MVLKIVRWLAHKNGGFLDSQDWLHDEHPTTNWNVPNND